MVEDVVGVKAELSLDALGDGEVLGDRQVREERAGAKEAVDSNVADSTASRKRKASGSGTCHGASVLPDIGRTHVISERRDGNEVVPVAVNFARTNAERLAFHKV